MIQGGDFPKVRIKILSVYATSQKKGLRCFVENKEHIEFLYK